MVSYLRGVEDETQGEEDGPALIGRVQKISQFLGQRPFLFLNRLRVKSKT